MAKSQAHGNLKRAGRARAADWIELRRRRWEEKLKAGGYRAAEAYDATIRQSAAYAILTDEALRAEVVDRPWLLIEMVFTIVDKKSHLVPFFFNEVQADIVRNLEERGGGTPFYILKGRQQGVTSVITAIQNAYSVVRRNFSGFTISHRADSTAAIFNDKARQSLERLPELLRPHEKFNSRNEIFFDKLNSSWRCATATDEVGRSATLNFVHFSEVAFYECDWRKLQAGIMNACTQDAIVFYETTANGFGDTKDLWDGGTCINLFYAWWRSPEYRRAGSVYRERADAWLGERLRWLTEQGLDDEQLEWYAWKYDSYLDKALIRQEYPCFPDEAFLFSGAGVFDNEALGVRLAQVLTVQDVEGEFLYDKVAIPIEGADGAAGFDWVLTNIRFSERRGGMIRIHKEPREQHNDRRNPERVTAVCPYVIGCDTAGSGDDDYTAKVVDAMTGVSAATLQVKRIDEDRYAEQVLCLAHMYNNAMIAMEINFSAFPLRVICQQYGYTNVYMREDYDTAADRITQSPGFRTTAQTKPVIIWHLAAVLRENPALENDAETIRQLMTFVKKDTGNGSQKLEAVSGAHDDLVMALAIAHQARTQAQDTWQTVKDEAVGSIAELLGDADAMAAAYVGENGRFAGFDEL